MRCLNVVSTLTACSILCCAEDSDSDKTDCEEELDETVNKNKSVAEKAADREKVLHMAEERKQKLLDVIRAGVPEHSK